MTAKLDDALWWYERVRKAAPVLRWLDRFADHDSALLRHSHLVGAVASVFARSADLPETEH